MTTATTVSETETAIAVREEVSPLLTRAMAATDGQSPPPLTTSIATATATETVATGWTSIETMDVTVTATVTVTETETVSAAIVTVTVTATATATGIGTASGMEILEAAGTRERRARSLRRGVRASSSTKTT